MSKDLEPIEIPYVGTNWVIAEWPDGFWCEMSELHEMGHRSDDYQVLKVLSYDESYTPVKTEVYKL